MTTILIKKKDTAGAPAPGDLTNAAGGTEIAVNTATKRIYTKDSGGNVVELGTNSTSSTIDQLTVTTSTTLSYGTANQVQYLNASKLLVGSANMTFNGTTLTANTIGAFTLGGTIAGGGNQINNVIIGTSTPLAGSFTTLTASTSITNSSLTTGRVVYTSTGGLETSSANLLYSGTDLTVYGITVGRGAGAVSSNTVVGGSALATNTSGSSNTVVGYQAANRNVSGANNSIFGYNAAYWMTGSFNTAVGDSSLGTNNSAGTGSNNVAVGYQSLFNNIASNNTAVGYQAGYSNTTAAENVFVGYQSGYANQTGVGLTLIGHLAGTNNTGSDNTALGFAALRSNTSGASNVAIGGGVGGVSNGALGSNLTGSFNVAVGKQALQGNTTASYNTAVGYQAGYTNVAGATVTYLGYQAGYTATGGNNTFVGTQAGYAVTTGAKNTILGRYDGNQNSLDIRTASKYVVLSDGDGVPNFVSTVNGGDSYLPGGSPLYNTSATFQSTLHLGDNVALMSYANAGNRQLQLASNLYYNGGYKYKTSYGASKLALGTLGSWEISGATAGTADALASMVTILGSEGIGATVYLQGGVSSSGIGIAFPASQSASTNANTLDDYEEGTFTPTYSSAGISAVTYGSGQNGYYTKIGRMVTATINIMTNSVTVTNSSSDVVLSGLPFTSANNSESSSTGAVGFAIRWAVNTPKGFAIVPNSSDVRLFSTAVTTAEDETNLKVSDMVASGSGNRNTIRITFVYFV